MVAYREMRAADIAAVCEIERMTFSDPWSADGFAAALAMPGNLYVCALSGEQVAGYCGLYRSMEEGEIVNVAVHPAFRRQGVAEGMLRFLLDSGERAGITRYILEVREGNAAAIHLYRKLGFAGLGVRRDFYANPRENALIMALACADGQ